MNLKDLSNEEIKEKIISKEVTVADVVDSGICPTCFDKENNHVLYGDNTDKMIYEDDDFEAFLVGNPRANGHVAISTKVHYKDMMEIPEELCIKIFLLAKKTMNIIKEVYNTESVYLCTMCDGPMNHFHVQLIPRYDFEKRGSKNFVKPRFDYVEDKEKIKLLRNKLGYKED
jgi:histidine triad (HIT) family protein